jgi:hypothetical protein
MSGVVRADAYDLACECGLHLSVGGGILCNTDPTTSFIRLVLPAQDCSGYCKCPR